MKPGYKILFGSKGFTLLEMLVSVTLIATLSFLTYSTLNRSQKEQAKAGRISALLHEVRVSFTRMDEDFSQAFLASGVLSGTTQSFTAGFKGTETSVNFSTLSNVHYVPGNLDTDQVAVGYFLEKKGDLQSLMRRQTSYLSEKIDEGGTAYPLVENVKEITFEYFDFKKDEWVTEWDNTTVSVFGRLPQAVRVKLVVIDSGRERVFSTIFKINLYNNVITF